MSIPEPRLITLTIAAGWAGRTATRAAAIGGVSVPRFRWSDHWWFFLVLAFPSEGAVAEESTSLFLDLLGRTDCRDIAMLRR